MSEYETVADIIAERDRLRQEVAQRSHLGPLEEMLAKPYKDRAERAEADNAALRAVYTKAREMFEQATVLYDQYARPCIDPPDYFQALERAVADTALALGE